MRVLIVPNSDNGHAVEAARSLSAHLARQGHEPLLAESDAVAIGLDDRGAAVGAFGELDLVVALGGDGTILKAVHLLDGSGVPILGVNLGRLGFLAGADGDGLIPAVEKALAGEGVIERRRTLEVTIRLGGRAGGVHHVLNEVFVGRGPGGRAVNMAVAVNGVELTRAVCDGMIVATPTGSTAYALSAGGPVMAPDVAGMLVVTVNPHTLVSRPVVLGPGDVVTLTAPDPARAGVCVMVDGDTLPCRAALDRVDVRVGPQEVALVRLDGRGFYETARDTFFGG
ncbi:MAG: NAD(+)/NADH kinase [Coriobacteriia bacterium]|nr:NAD(+)/NADH kinase [Coriobacteriia bacterium]